MAVSEIALPCVIKDNGAIEIDRAELLQRLKDLKPGPGMLRIQRKRPKHSDPARGYYFAVVVKVFREHTGYTSKEAHEWLKAFNLDKAAAAEGRNGRLLGDGYVIGGSIADLDVSEMHEYIERCREFLVTECHATTPDPDQDYRQHLAEARALGATKASARRMRGDWDTEGVPV